MDHILILIRNIYTLVFIIRLIDTYYLLPPPNPHTFCSKISKILKMFGNIIFVSKFEDYSILGLQQSFGVEILIASGVPVPVPTF